MNKFYTMRSRSIKVKGLDKKVFAVVDAFKTKANWSENTAGMEQMLRKFSDEVTAKHTPYYFAVATKIKEDIKFENGTTVYEWDGTKSAWNDTDTIPGEAIGCLKWDRNQWFLIPTDMVKCLKSDSDQPVAAEPEPVAAELEKPKRTYTRRTKAQIEADEAAGIKTRRNRK